MPDEAGVSEKEVGPFRAAPVRDTDRQDPDRKATRPPSIDPADTPSQTSPDQGGSQSRRRSWTSATLRPPHRRTNAAPETTAEAALIHPAKNNPAEWLPSDGSYHCTYAATWVGTKLRWDLAADENEVQALLGLAEDCPTTTVVYESAPSSRPDR